MIDLSNIVALLEVLRICVGCRFLQLAVHPSARAVLYMGADKSLAQPGRKQANLSVRMA